MTLPTPIPDLDEDQWKVLQKEVNRPANEIDKKRKRDALDLLKRLRKK